MRNATPANVTDFDGQVDRLLSDEAIFRIRLKSILKILGQAKIQILLDDIKSMTKNLETLTGQSLSGTQCSTRASSTQSASKYYAWIRRHAEMLHQTLKETLFTTPGCACSPQHLPGLQLMMFSPSTMKSPGKCGTSELRFTVGFNVLGSSCDELRLLDMEPMLYATPKSGTDRPKSAALAVVEVAVPIPTPEESIATKKESFGGKFKRLVVKAFLSSGKFVSLTGLRVCRLLNPLSGKKRPRMPSAPSLPPNPRTVTVENQPQSQSRVRFADTPDSTSNWLPENDNHIIRKICEIIVNNPIQHAEAAFGILHGTSDKRPRIWPCTPTQMRTTRTVTLAQILSGSLQLSRAKRFTLGVRLASAVAHLHDTAWLPVNWTSGDILFVQDSATPNIDEIIKTPLLRP